MTKEEYVKVLQSDEKELKEYMGRSLWHVEKVNELSIANKKLISFLRKLEEWEAKFIMEDNCWKNGLPNFTQEISERNQLLEQNN